MIRSLPRITTLEALHAPVSLSRGRTPLRVVASGNGVLRVDGHDHAFRGGVDSVFLVTPAPVIVVEVRVLWGLISIERHTVTLPSPLPTPSVAVAGFRGVETPRPTLPSRMVRHAPCRPAISVPHLMIPARRALIPSCVPILRGERP